MLKVGLIGCGFMGNQHADCYKNLENVELAAVADIRAEKAQSIAEGTNAVIYSDGLDLIANADVDVIDICLPTYLHAEYALAAMDKVKYLFVEKPVTLTVKESKELIKKAEKTGCQVQVGQVIRFWDEYEYLRDVIAENKYGKIINANFRRLSPTPEWGWNNWLHNVSQSGGAAQDLHIHDIDYVLSLFGQPKKLNSITNVIGEQKSYINTIMQYDEFVVGVEGTWNLPATHPFQATFRVVFENAVIENSPEGFMLYTADKAEKITIEKKQMTSSGKTKGNISDLGGYFKELLYFTDKAAAGEPIERARLVDAAESLKFLLTKEL